MFVNGGFLHAWEDSKTYRAVTFGISLNNLIDLFKEAKAVTNSKFDPRCQSIGIFS
jgi:hypothetical protein